MRNKRARQARTWFYPLFVLALGGAAILTSGCGGSGGGGGRSAFQVTAQFEPYSGKDIASYVGSIKVTAQTGSDTPLGPYTLNRGSNSQKIEGLAAGKTYRFTVEGFQGTNGTGSKVSYAQFDRVAPNRGQTTDVAITTMATEIASVTVSPSTVDLAAGESQVYAFEARNSSGAVILTDAQDSSFQVSINPNVGTFDSNTNTYTAPNVISSGQPASTIAVSIGGVTGNGTINFVNGELQIDLKWNADGRGLPGYAGSARLSIVNGGIILPGSERNVTRTQNGAHTQRVVWDDVPFGNYMLNVEAYGTGDFSGPVVASASFPVDIVRNGGVETIDMSAADFKPTKIDVYVQRGGLAPVLANNEVVVNENETVRLSAVATDGNGTVFLSGNQLRMSVTGSNATLNGDWLTANIRGTGSTLTVNSGDTPPGQVNLPIDVVFGNPGGIIEWDAPTRDAAPGYAKSAMVTIAHAGGGSVQGYAPLCVDRPATGSIGAFWPNPLPTPGTFDITVTLFTEFGCAGHILMSDTQQVTTDNQGLIVNPPVFNGFPTIGDASAVEVHVTRADGTLERYWDPANGPVPSGRREGPIFLSFGEEVTIATRVTGANGQTTYFTETDVQFTGGNVDFDSSTMKARADNLGQDFVDASAQPGRGPSANFEVRVMPPAAVAFSDYDDEAFGGLGAVKSYLYVPGARVNSPRGDKIWEIPYRDDAYLGLPLAEPGVVLPTDRCNGYDVFSPALNSRGTKVALVIGPFDTVSGDVTLYKDIVVMDISYDANGAPIFGAIMPQNLTYDSDDQIGPMFGPQEAGAPEGRLYWSTIPFARPTGSYLANTERDIIVRGNIFDAPSAGTNNLTSNINGHFFWPTISPDNRELASIRKVLGAGAVGDLTVDAQPVGVGNITTYDLTNNFGQNGNQVDVTASASSRIGYIASMGVATFPSGNLINTNNYYIVMARSFDGGWTNQVELLLAQNGAMANYVVQQLNASNPFGAAIDGAQSLNQFKVRDPRRVMCYIYQNTQLMAKNVTSPAAGGIGTQIYQLDPDIVSTNIPSQPVWPAPFDVFAPLPR
jgi:hypothetical protein